VCIPTAGQPSLFPCNQLNKLKIKTLSYLLGSLGGLYLVYPNQLYFGKEIWLLQIVEECFFFSLSCSVLNCPNSILSMPKLRKGFAFSQPSFAVPSTRAGAVLLKCTIFRVFGSICRDQLDYRISTRRSL
jgi:hypothetical protein